MERIPAFFAFLLAASVRNSRGACCFVLDKTEGTAALTAVLLALARLQDEFQHLAEEFARTALREGLLVRVKPSDFVYEYEGVWEGHPGKFRLKVQNKSEWRSFPMDDVLRLEPTARTRPKGTLVSHLGAFSPSSLDELLGISTYGNHSMLRNAVLLYIAQATFADISTRVSLAPDHLDHLDQLSSFLPWGTVGPGGSIRAIDTYQVVGEPLVAVTKVIQDLAGAARSSPSESKIVVVDGTRGLANDLQAFDDIADRQRVIILASPDDIEDIRVLRDRDCPIWYMSPSEITIGESDAGERPRASLVGRTLRMAAIRERTRVLAINCQSNELQRVTAALEQAAGKLVDAEQRSEADEVLASVYRVLLEYSECCFGVGDEVRTDLERARRIFVEYRRWMAPEIREGIQFSIEQLQGILGSRSASEEKADKLVNFLLGCDGRWIISARSPRTAETLRQGLKDWGIDVPVLPIQAIHAREEYDGIVLLTWPNRRRFARLSNSSVSPEIRLLAYPFENRWLAAHQRREEMITASSRLEAAERAAIVGIGVQLLATMADTRVDMNPEPTADETLADSPLLSLERRISQHRPAHSPASAGRADVRRARLVEFHGGCYSLFTEWAHMHVLNGISGDRIKGKVAVQPVAVVDIAEDDLVLFRAAAEKGFIRLLAEDELGITQYERTRAAAELWKLTLRRLGSTPAAVQRSLGRVGLNRNLQTIAGWMENPELIGPGYEEDIELIAAAANDDALLSGLASIKESISRIRGAHVAAGSRLTQLILGEVQGRLAQVDEEPILLDLGFGQAWVVQVRAIDTRLRIYPADQTNRLLWDDDFAF